MTFFSFEIIKFEQLLFSTKTFLNITDWSDSSMLFTFSGLMDRHFIALVFIPMYRDYKRQAEGRIIQILNVSPQKKVLQSETYNMNWKLKIILLSLILPIQLLAQSNKKIIHSNNAKTTVVEGIEKHNWYLDAEVKLDVYAMDKHKSAKTLKLYTDIDSLILTMNPGDTFDCIILLNGKDSCHTRFHSDAPITKYLAMNPAVHDTLKFELTEGNNINVETIINGQDTLNLHFDTGGSGLVLTQKAIQEKLNSIPKSDRENLENYVPVKSKVDINLGSFDWDGQTIYPVTLTPEGTDGH